MKPDAITGGKEKCQHFKIEGKSDISQVKNVKNKRLTVEMILPFNLLYFSVIMFKGVGYKF